MNDEERQKILARAQTRRAATPPPSPTPQVPQATVQQPKVRISGDREAKIEIIEPGSKAARGPRVRGNLTVQEQPRGGTQRTYGATVINPDQRPGNVRVQAQPQQKVYGAKLISHTETESSTGVKAVLSTPLPTQRPPGPGPGMGPQPNVPPELAAAMSNLTPSGTANLMGGMPVGYGPQPTPPQPQAAPVIPVDVTIILSQWMRPDVFERQLRALDAQNAQCQRLLVINPSPIRLDPKQVQHVQRVPHVRASEDMGPWVRWLWATGVQTRYVLVADDDWLPGPEWLRLAVERMDASDAEDRVCVAAGGVVYNSDVYNDVFPVGPESLQREETVVDAGCGAWLMRTEWARTVFDFPKIGSPMSTKLHVAAALQHDGIQTIVLPYPHNNRNVWGMLEPPRPGTIAMHIDAQANQTGVNSEQIRYQDYLAFRHDADWEPLCVMVAKAAQKEPPADPAAQTQTESPIASSG